MKHIDDTTNLDAVVTFTDKAFELARNVDPSVETKEDVAAVLKKGLNYGLLTRPENAVFEIWVMHRLEDDERDMGYSDYYEHLGEIRQDQDAVDAIIPVLSVWFQKKYADKKRAYLEISKIGRAPLTHTMFDIDDMDLGVYYTESVK